MCYYTVTLDHNVPTEGHKRAIMILDAKDKTEATAKFLNTFGPQYYNEVKLIEGIHIPEGFDRLLTEQARKYIMKVKTKAEDAPPLMSYQNMLHLTY
jgi:homoaconitase/3-isopropylmalate dehydratase large subunit